MSTVCATALLLCTVDLNVRDEQLVGVQALQLSIGLCVGEQVQHELSRFLRPTSLPVGGASILGLGSTANTTTEATECDRLLVLNDVLKVRHSLPEHHALDGVACLTGVLEMNSEV